MVQYKEKYYIIKKYLTKLKKANFFDKYDAGNLFFLFNKMSKAIISTLNDNFASIYNVSLYFGNDGYNYLYDCLTSQTGYSVTYNFADFISLNLVKKELLAKEDITYLESHKIGFQKDYNLIPVIHKKGYNEEYLNTKECDLCIEYLNYLWCLVKNEEASLLEEFAQDKQCVAYFDMDKYLYTLEFQEINNFQILPTPSKKNLGFVKEYQDTVYLDDTCHLLHCFIPSLPQKEVKNLLLIYYEKNKEYYYEVIECKPKMLKDYLYGFLDEYFREIGVPLTLIVDSLDNFARLKNTMEALNIEILFERENEELNDLIYDIVRQELTKNSQEDGAGDYVS